MTCTKNTYPIDLINTINNCDITCNLNFDYNNSSIVVKNIDGTYLSIEYESASNPNVTFSATKYTANEIRIFMPSLHTYNGKRSDAEILINHFGNNNKHLLISIPIVNKGFLSNSANTLARIVQDMESSKLNNFTEPLNITNYTLNLNDIVPEKPFFYYEGCSNHPNMFTNTNVKIIAYNYTQDNNSSGAIFVDDIFIKNLSALLTNPNKISTVQIPKEQIFYNMNGPGNSKKENIYIDCQPTNEDGELYVPINNNNDFNPNNFLELFKDKKTLSIIKALFGLFIMFIILWVAKILMVGILSRFSSSSLNDGNT